METKKVSKKWLIIISVFLFLTVFSSKAKAEPKDIAIDNAKIISSERNDIKIGFDLANNGNGIETGIKYTIKLEDNSVSLFVDSKVFDEILTFGNNEKIHKEINYIAPAYLKGDYIVWIAVGNEAGLSSFDKRVGEIILNGSGEYVYIEDMCYMSVEGDLRKYTLSEGIDVAKDEKIRANFNIINHFNEPITIAPVFETYYRSTYGNLISTEKQSDIALNPGENNNFSLIIPKPDSPQAYDAVLILLDSQGKKISNSRTFHFVVRGASATIQDLKLDKDFYKKGETAEISLFWTGSADNFPLSRQKGTTLDKAMANLTIKNSNGQNCIGEFEKNLSEQNQSDVVRFNVPIISNCSNPQVSLIIKDGNGDILAQKDVEISTAPGENGGKVDKGAKITSLSKKIGYIVTIILTISAVVLIVSKRYKRTGINSIFLLFLTIAFLFCLLGVKDVKADNTTVSYSAIPDLKLVSGDVCTSIDACTANYEADVTSGGKSLKNATVSPNSPIIITLQRTLKVSACANTFAGSGTSIWMDEVNPLSYPSTLHGPVYTNLLDYRSFRNNDDSDYYRPYFSISYNPNYGKYFYWDYQSRTEKETTDLTSVPPQVVALSAPLTPGKHTLILTGWGFGQPSGSGTHKSGFDNSNSDRAEIKFKVSEDNAGSPGPFCDNGAYKYRITWEKDNCTGGSYQVVVDNPDAGTNWYDSYWFYPVINLNTLSAVFPDNFRSDNGSTIPAPEVTNSSLSPSKTYTYRVWCASDNGRNRDYDLFHNYIGWTPITMSADCTGHKLIVNVGSTSGGKITSDDFKIDCGAMCQYDYANNTEVLLKAISSSSDYMFDHWGGACAGTVGDSCTVTMDKNKAATAHFKCSPEYYCNPDPAPKCTGKDCGKILTAPTRCVDLNSCNNSVKDSDCNNGAGCGSEFGPPVICPACNDFKVNNFQEVTP